MSKELPGEWGELLGPKGIHSYRDMAAATGIAAGTMHRLVTGKSTSVETVNRVADTFFDGDRDLVWRLRGSQRRDYGDWELPPEASLLTEAQRNAVLAVIQVMVPGEQEEVMGNAEHPAPKTERPTLKAARAVGRDGSLSRQDDAEEAMRRQLSIQEGEAPEDPGASA